MSNKFIIGIDQSTQATKAILFDVQGRIVERRDLTHTQIINDRGWVEHDPAQIYSNTIAVVKELIKKASISSSDVAGVGITNQRETAVAWDKETGMPVYNAIVWQCKRGEAICKRLEGYGEFIRSRTGLQLSPYFSAAKIAWLLENVEGLKTKSEAGRIAYGTMDSWLIYKLTGGKSFKTDFSNASRTQMFNINELKWDEDICKLFGINPAGLAEVCESNACFGKTDLGGILAKPVPIHSVLGDSHAALFGQNCLDRGGIKSTYGTGSSIMMNIGEKPLYSKKGLVTSLAWSMDGRVQYVLEGNINYSGAVIRWLENDLKLIENESDAEDLANKANPADRTYLVPAFTGLGAPYWKNDAAAVICGMTRLTGKAELVRAALDSIVYQITDIINIMRCESGIDIKELKVDGGPTRNNYLMQLQSDLLNIPVQTPSAEELSAIGAAYAAGIALGIYNKSKVIEEMKYHSFCPQIKAEERAMKLAGWKSAVELALKR